MYISLSILAKKQKWRKIKKELKEIDRFYSYYLKVKEKMELMSKTILMIQLLFQ